MHSFLSICLVVFSLGMILGAEVQAKNKNKLKHRMAATAQFAVDHNDRLKQAFGVESEQSASGAQQVHTRQGVTKTILGGLSSVYGQGSFSERPSVVRRFKSGDQEYNAYQSEIDAVRLQLNNSSTTATLKRKKSKNLNVANGIESEKDAPDEYALENRILKGLSAVDRETLGSALDLYSGAINAKDWDQKKEVTSWKVNLENALNKKLDAVESEQQANTDEIQPAGDS